jgi:hypothetical protein
MATMILLYLTKIITLLNSYVPSRIVTSFRTPKRGVASVPLALRLPTFAMLL